MITSVDTNILLDILIPGTNYCITSKGLLDVAIKKGSIIICEIVYAELSSQFKNLDELENFLKDTGIKLTPTNKKALNLAGEMWSVYSKRKKKSLRCSKCGEIQDNLCKNCGARVSYRYHIISDFIIGSHALLQSNVLLTRDRGFYKDYYKDLMIHPSN